MAVEWFPVRSPMISRCPWSSTSVNWLQLISILISPTDGFIYLVVRMLGCYFRVNFDLFAVIFPRLKWYISLGYHGVCDLLFICSEMSVCYLYRYYYFALIVASFNFCLWTFREIQSCLLTGEKKGSSGFFSLFCFVLLFVFSLQANDWTAFAFFVCFR
jgi:hypothetical protein